MGNAQMDFTSIDVETANPDLSSICQIGVVQFRDSAIVHEWKSYVNPNDYFDPMNVSVHGIDEAAVDSAPTFTDIADQIQGYLTSSVVCCHTSFDRTAIYAAHAKNNLTPPEIQWNTMVRYRASGAENLARSFSVWIRACARR
jgi:DNA polymerase-3 subunit epsilon